MQQSLIEIGKYNELEILRETSVGLYLGDEDGEDILLPNKYIPESYAIGDKINVYVYLDYAERKIATTLTPKIKLYEFALLEVAAISEIGAFMDMGLEKHLLVPFNQQRDEMEEGRWYIVFMDIDRETERLFGSNKLKQYLKNEDLTVQEGDEVDILIARKTPIGYDCIINHLYTGLLYKNEIFEPLRIGDQRKAFIKKIREDQKIDLSLQPKGYSSTIDSNVETVLELLKEFDGHLGYNDKSEPDAIRWRFGLSKKAFKKAIGSLYKDRKITIEEDGIRLTT